MKKLLAAIVAGMFALSTVPAVLAAKHEMKDEKKAQKAEKKKAEPKKKGEDKKKAEPKKKGEDKKKKAESK